jgi:hypothetical protein
LKNGDTNYREVLQDDESLCLFLKSLKKFDQAFCDHIADGDDFTLKIEVHGNQGKMLHVRVSSDGFKRPPGVEREIDRKR